ncbi:MAG TPA: hypothetical protein VN929_17010 [Burkholderiales bacterium]|nr:hypothetical protein [Burkholderiales bacterium]
MILKQGRRISRSTAYTMIAAVALLLSACSSTLQVYSSPEHETLHLQQHELREGGLAFLTPSTVTGQEEDKQALAHVFATTLQAERADIRLVPLSATLSAVNRAGLADAYRTMYQNYRDTGVFDGATMRRVAQAAGVRYLAQLKLANMQQSAKSRWSLLGFSILQTQYANLRVFFQIWDSRDGSIAWEGIDEVTFAMDTGLERPISFRSIAEHAAKDLIQGLP